MACAKTAFILSLKVGGWKVFIAITSFQHDSIIAEGNVARGLMQGEVRNCDDFLGDYHGGLCPEMAGLLRPGPFAGVHPVKGEGKYQKHYIYLNSYTLYVVEDISGADVDPYHYELNIIPEMVGCVKVTSKK